MKVSLPISRHQPGERLEPQPGERIDRSRTLTFTFDGRKVRAHPGDTIASALYAAGRRTFSRSFKYHRRRGLMCVAGQCPNCICAVDGNPGARACTEPVREGMEVTHLNALPSLELDAMRATDIFGSRFTPPGFYYKTFIRPRRLWPLYEKVLRNAAGLGKLREFQPEREWRTEYRRRHADVLVTGGGVAGLHAATAAAGAGADVVLVDEGAAPGGQLLVEGRPQATSALVEAARAAGVELIERGSALGCFDGLVPVWQNDTLHQVRAAQHVFATGAIEQPLVFAGNDLPGVMLAGGARRLVSLYAVQPGTRAVIATTSDRGIDAAVALRKAGVEILAVADLRSTDSDATAALRATGVEVLSGHTVVCAEGSKRVERATLAPAGARGTASDRSFDCDLVVVSGGAIPATSLLLQAGATSSYDDGQGHFALAALPDGVHAAGEVAGHDSAERAAWSGELAGLRAASALGLGGEEAQRRAAELEGLIAGAAPSRVAVPPPVSGEGRGGKCFACFCEDVSSKDVHLSIEEGYDSIELSKRYTTVTMGPCQGRMCQLPAVRLMAQETGRSLADVGVTTARPPWVSVPMGILGGRPVEPAKRSPIHGRHRELGANVKWAGDWRRPYDYGDPAGEALNVNRAAGLIDVSTLGKLIVRGPDAGRFLDLLYPNRLSNLAPGRIRYGVISSDAGRIVDDGTVCRLDEDSFYVTTTSSGAGAVDEWFSWWLAVWKLDVRLTDVTQGLAAINLAGPQAREILQAVTELDCSAEGFTYLDAKHAAIAGVDCLILRIGFVGEVGYEIHCPAANGEHVWDALSAAGAERGLRPFGLEPQRILRLQKLHVIVGQDTDSESTPYGAAMPWAVKLDKEDDFIGKWALEHYAEWTPETMLVGFTVASGEVPTEGAVVVDEAGLPAGQVTSARHSATLDRTIGMAWVPEPLARDGAVVTISDAGRQLRGEVQTRPFYDPEGELLRS
ncbi:MAG: 2Fe-2S iron-sulfur cluster-binding protein [Conexibacteraceae bacterium]|nr:2Fe-2S iron-sulfur cluster-binding protein [Conexibacteraceae bacterium]